MKAPTHLAVVPPRTEDPVAPWLTLKQIALRYQTHPETIRRHVLQGLPCIDIAHHRPGKRTKRNLRFNPIACDRWLEGRR